MKIAAAVEALVAGLPVKALGERAERISKAYRANRSSSEIIADETDAAVYALMRMPATAAAVEAVLDALIERLPDFSPATLLDAGAGPGTASLVAAERWPAEGLTLIDSHPDFLGLALRLLGQELPEIAGRVRCVAGDIVRPETALPEADLVIASYALTELDDRAHQVATDRLWAATRKVLVVIEPGRPRDYGRLMAFRHKAAGEGAQVVAPCPHGSPCPLADADWCHFSVRLPRSRTHRRLKGAALGYEDEKFSYLVLARPGLALRPPLARVLARPEALKPETRLKLCRPDGTADWRAVARRSPHFSRIRRLKWGDSLPNEEHKGQE